MVAGMTGSGKSVFTMKFIKNLHEMVDKKIEEVVWCYGISQPVHKDIPGMCPVPVRFSEGVPDLEELCRGEPRRRLVVIDDLFRQTDGTIADLFTRSSHHCDLSCIFITQNLFFQNKMSRDISLNTQYCVVFFSPRDRAQVQYFCRQVDPDNSKFLMEAFKEATSLPHGYMLFDMKQGTEEAVRYRSDIFPGESNWVYVRKGLKL
jgi:Cdc6-like AAA superfamily ATPase